MPRKRRKEILVKDGAALNEQLKLLWIGMGTQEPDPFPGAMGGFRAMLNKANCLCRSC